MISRGISVGKKGGGRRRMRRLRVLEGGLLCKNSIFRHIRLVARCRYSTLSSADGDRGASLGLRAIGVDQRLRGGKEVLAGGCERSLLEERLAAAVASVSDEDKVRWESRVTKTVENPIDQAWRAGRRGRW